MRNLVGQKFGRLEVLERDLNNKDGRPTWKCKCDCGNIKTVIQRSLEKGFTKSCGCIRKNPGMREKGMIVNLLNKKFGKLLVIKRIDAPNKYSKYAWWLCKCDCGNEKNIAGYVLRRGTSNSCGCIKKIPHNKSPDREERLWLVIYNTSIKRRSRENNHKFDIDFESFKKLVSQNCYYCGCEPNLIMYDHSRNHYRNPEDKRIYISENTVKHHTVDRIDSYKGYTKDNTVSCCRTCNIMKNTLTQEEFYQHIINIYEHSRLMFSKNSNIVKVEYQYPNLN